MRTVVLKLTQKISAISCPSHSSLPPERSLRSAHRLSVQLHSKTNACGPMRTSAPTKSIVNAPTSIRRKSRARLWSIERVRGNHPKGFPGLFFLLPGVFFLEKQKENAVRFPFPGKSKQRKECGHQTGSEFLKIPPTGEKTRKKRGKFQIISRISLAFSAKGWYNPIILIV